MNLPAFVQSPRFLSVGGVFHAFLGVDPVAGRGADAVLREVFSVPPARVGTLRQVHGAAALQWAATDAPPDGDGKRRGDALWTAAPGTGVGVFTADCAPILLAHPRAKAVAAIHAGWRGLVAGVVGAAVDALASGSGVPRDELAAAVGPCARGCCYEVGEDVAEALRRLPGGDRAVVPSAAAGKATADIMALSVSALRAAGVPAENTGCAGACTVCGPSFRSFRREKSLTGRQLSFIYIV